MCSGSWKKLFAIYSYRLDHHWTWRSSTVVQIWRERAYSAPWLICGKRFTILRQKCGVRSRSPVFRNADSGLPISHTRSPRLQSPKSGVRRRKQSPESGIAECGVRECTSKVRSVPLGHRIPEFGVWDCRVRSPGSYTRSRDVPLGHHTLPFLATYSSSLLASL